MDLLGRILFILFCLYCLAGIGWIAVVIDKISWDYEERVPKYLLLTMFVVVWAFLLYGLLGPGLEIVPYR